MRRNFNLSGIGLGLYLLGLGFSYLLLQSGGSNFLSFWSGLYPILIILLGLDYILANSERASYIFAKPNGLVVAIVIIITVVGLIHGFTAHLQREIREFRNFHAFNQRHFEWHQGYQFSVNQDFQLPPGITTVKIENQFGDIRVNTAADKNISANARVRQPFFRRYNGNTRSFLKFAAEIQDRVFLITLQRPQGFRFKNMNKHDLNADITINIPKGLSVDVKNTAGNVDVAAVDGNLNVNMVAGTLEVQKVSQALTIRNKLGTVNVGAVYGNADIISHSGQIKVGKLYGSSYIENSFGELILDECHGPVTAKLKTGNLNIKLANVKGNCDIDIKMGNIDLGLPAEAKFTLDSECLMGEIHSDFNTPVKKDLTKASCTGAVNGGGPSVKIRSKSGNIRLYKL
jgi:hypothetical protein